MNTLDKQGETPTATLDPSEKARPCPTEILSGRQQRLAEALEALETEHDLRGMYLGAIVTLGATCNPDRIPQCAHSVRELMEKLPASADLPHEKHGSVPPDLSKAIQELEDMFQKAKLAYSPLGNASQGDITDEPTKRLLDSLDHFFERFTKPRPTRLETAMRYFDRLANDASGQPLPPTTKGHIGRTWSRLWKFFVPTSHHRNSSPEEQEFRGYLGELERFLLDRLVPKMAEDLNEIDTILHDAQPEGGSDA